MRYYDMTTTADITARLDGYRGNNYQKELENLRDKIGSDIYDNFNKELTERLNSRDYESKTVVGESLVSAGNQYFRPMNYQIKEAMKRDSQLMDEDELIEKYTGRNYKTASDEDIADYAYFLTALNNVNFFF